MSTRPAFITDQMLMFLDDLYIKGFTLMLNWKYLREHFTDLTPEQAQETINYWKNQ